jgi:hypothetical protein
VSSQQSSLKHRQGSEPTQTLHSLPALGSEASRLSLDYINPGYLEPEGFLIDAVESGTSTPWLAIHHLERPLMIESTDWQGNDKKTMIPAEWPAGLPVPCMSSSSFSNTEPADSQCFSTICKPHVSRLSSAYQRQCGHIFQTRPAVAPNDPSGYFSLPHSFDAIPSRLPTRVSSPRHLGLGGGPYCVGLFDDPGGA